MHKGSEGYKSVSDFLQLDSTQEYGTSPHPQITYRTYKTCLIA